MRAAATTATLFAASLLVAGCGGSKSSGSSAAANQLAVPLNSSVSLAGSTWAVVPMGLRGSVANTFWQLFVLAGGAGKWRLATPPGVADNGGLSIGAPPVGGPVVAGFEASELLGFSPLALTSSDGSKWATATMSQSLAALPQPLVPVGASVEAITGTGPTSAVTVSAAGAPAGWTTLATERRLATTPAGRRCGLTGITALAHEASGATLIGGACSNAGTVGLFLLTRSGVTEVGSPVALPGGGRDHDVIVTRIVPFHGGFVNVLVAEQSSSGDWRLVAVDPVDDATSAPLALEGPRSLIATGTMPAGGFFAVVDEGKYESGDVIEPAAGTGAAWSALPELPTGTATLAFGSAGRVDALVAKGERMVDFRLEATTWRQVQVLRVPIAYGSSG